MTKKYTFPTSPICFWIKGSVEVGTKIAKVTTRNTVLGFIPAGSNQQTIPLSNVSTVQVRTGVKLKKIIFGVFFALCGLGACLGGGGMTVFGIIIILIGIDMIIAGRPVFLDIETGGTTRTFYAPMYAKNTIKQISEDMNEKIADIERHRDVSSAADKIINAINDNGTIGK